MANNRLSWTSTTGWSGQHCCAQGTCQAASLQLAVTAANHYPLHQHCPQHHLWPSLQSAEPSSDLLRLGRQAAPSAGALCSAAAEGHQQWLRVLNPRGQITVSLCGVPPASDLLQACNDHQKHQHHQQLLPAQAGGCGELHAAPPDTPTEHTARLFTHLQIAAALPHTHAQQQQAQGAAGASRSDSSSSDRAVGSRSGAESGAA